jgi:inositol-1,4,5-trisphosphate 5-phosphatase
LFLIFFFLKLCKFDNELEAFDDKLFEFNKLFPPSYPFSEEINVSNEYMDSRCPSWCDRILVDSLFKNLVDYKTTYDMIGKDVCMGDHKVRPTNFFFKLFFSPKMIKNYF